MVLVIIMVTRARFRDVDALSAVLEKHMKSPGFLQYGEELEDSPVLVLMPPSWMSLLWLWLATCARNNPHVHLPAFFPAG